MQKNERFLIIQRKPIPSIFMLRFLVFVACTLIGGEHTRGGVCSRFAPETVSPGTSIAVELRVSPEIDDFAYKIVEFIPESISVTQISGGGVWNERDRTLTWRSFSDGNVRSYRYVAHSDGNLDQVNWNGIADFDGEEVPIIGTTTTLVEKPVPGEVYRTIPNETVAGQVFEVELNVAPAPGTIFWTVEESISSGEIMDASDAALLLGSRAVRWGPFVSDTPQKFTYQIQTPGQEGELRFTGNGFFTDTTVDVQGPSTLKVKPGFEYLIQRNTERWYQPGNPLQVDIILELPQTPGLYAVEEQFPDGWNVSGLSEPYRIEGGNRIIWGPLTEGGLQELSYTLTAPADFSEDIILEGFLDIAGKQIATVGSAELKRLPEENIQAARTMSARYRVGEPFEIQLEINPTPATGLYRVLEKIPAGWSFVDADIAATWEQGTLRLGPFFDAESRVINYTVLPSLDAANSSSFQGFIETTEDRIEVQGNRITQALPPPSGTITRVQPEFYLPGEEIELVNEVRPDAEVTFYVVEQFVPEGWEIISSDPVSSSSQSGRRIVWGPYPDNTPRDFNLKVKAPENANQTADFPVNVFFNGIEVAPTTRVAIDVNFPPSLPNLRALAFAENSDIELRIPVSDPETPANQLEFDLIWDNSNLFDAARQSWSLDGNAYVVQLNPTPDSFGLSRFTMTLSDGSYQVDSDFSIQILEVNDPPEITLPSEITGAIEDSSRVTMFGIAVADRDAGVQPVQVTLALPAGSRWAPSANLVPEGVHQTLSGNEMLLSGSIPSLNFILNQLEWVPERDLSGPVPVRITVNDLGATGPGGAMETERVFDVHLQAVNDPPQYTPIGEEVTIQVWENASRGDTVFEEFIKNLSPGPDNESLQTLRPVMQISNEELFIIQPTISRLGTLSFQLAPDQFGESRIVFSFQDSGGRENGGWDISSASEFVIQALPVNRAPSAVSGIQTNELRIDTSDFQPILIPDFLTQITSGRLTEDQSGQQVEIITEVNRPDWFISLPVIDRDGALTFQPRPYTKGNATLTWTLQDDGPGFHPHSNISESTNFTLIFEAPNSAPQVLQEQDIVVFPENQGPVGRISGVYPGFNENQTDDIDLETSTAKLQWTSLLDGAVVESPVTLLKYSLYQTEPFPGLGVLECLFPTSLETALSTDLELHLSLADMQGARSEVRLPVSYYTINDAHWTRGSFTHAAVWSEVDPDSGLPLLQALEDSGSLNLELNSLFPSVPGGETSEWTLTQGEKYGILYHFDVESGSIDLIPDRFGEDEIQLTKRTQNSRVDWAFVLKVEGVPDAPRMDPFPEPIILENQTWTEKLTGMDPDDPGAPLLFELLDGPAGLTLDATGRLQWTPAETQGPGQFTVNYRARQASAEAGDFTDTQLTIQVLEQNRAPELVGTMDYILFEHERWHTDLKITDPDYPLQSVDVRLLTPVRGLRFQRISRDVVRITWRPEEIHGGQTRRLFLEIVDDGTPSLSSYQAIDLTILEVNDRPGFQPIDLTELPLESIPAEFHNRVAAWLETMEDTLVNWEISGLDPEQDAMSFEIIESPQHGSIQLTESVLTYTPHPDYYGLDSFQIASRDEQGIGEPYWVGINIIAVQDVPVLESDVFETEFETAFAFSSLDLLVNDRFVDDEILDVRLNPEQVFGQIVSGGDQSWIYTPPLNYSGSETLEYTVQSESFYRVGKITIRVLDPTDAPVIREFTLKIEGGLKYEFSVEDLLLSAVGEDALSEGWQVLQDSLRGIHDWSIRDLPNGQYEMTPPALGGVNKLRFIVTDPNRVKREIHVRVEASIMNPRIQFRDWENASGRFQLDLFGAPGWLWTLEQSVSVLGPWSVAGIYSPEQTLAQTQISEAIDLQNFPAQLADLSKYFWRLRQEPVSAFVKISIKTTADQILIIAAGEPYGRYTIYRKINLTAERAPWLRIELNEAGFAQVVQKIQTDEAVGFFSIGAGW